MCLRCCEYLYYGEGAGGDCIRYGRYKFGVRSLCVGENVEVIGNVAFLVVWPVVFGGGAVLFFILVFYIFGFISTRGHRDFRRFGGQERRRFSGCGSRGHGGFRRFHHGHGRRFTGFIHRS